MSITTVNIPKRSIPGVGPADAKIMLVGEAPGEVEERLGRPFVGPAGQLLDDLLHRAGIVRSACYVTNVIKERPPRNDIRTFIDITRGVARLTPTYYQYEEQLKNEIESVNPNVIVALGNIPLYTLCHLVGVTKYRGSVLESKLLPGRKVIHIIHPAAALRQYEIRHFISFDLRRVKASENDPALPVDTSSYVMEPTFERSMEYLEACLSAEMVAFDIEVSAGTVSCISFARGTNDVISIPFTQAANNYFTPPQEVAIWRQIDRVLSNPNIQKIAHNAMFDASFLLAKYGIIARPLQDTMIAQAILYPEFPKGLDFVTSIYTDFPYYKDEGKSVIKDQLKGIRRTKKDWELSFWMYNAKDSIVLHHAFPKMVDELIKQGNFTTYEYQTKLLQPLLYMTERGIRMDVKGLEVESKKAQARLDEIERELEQVSGETLNPRSPKQLMDYFYIKRRNRPYLHEGKPSINEKALKRLASKGMQEATLLLEHRQLAKLDSTYFRMQLDRDGRLRSSINPVGARTGRLSSSKTIFGTGANIQNQPPIMKKYMLPDEGYVIYNIDLSQAENRIVAYLGPDLAMVEAFEQGRDIHSTTASRIFNLPYEQVIEMNSQGVTANIGGGNLTHRAWGKRANHGLNYGLGYRSFALHLEIAEKEARFLWEQYHHAYPGVSKYHRMIQDQLAKDRTITNLFGRRFRFTDRWGDSLFKEAYAFIPQSTVADIINRRGLIFIYEDQEQFGPIELLAQVHDSIMFQIPLDVPIADHAAMVLAICNNLESSLQWFGRSFSIPADVSVHVRNAKDGAELKRFSKEEGAVERLEQALEGLWKENS